MAGLLNNSLQPDGRTLIVACDHGMISGPDKGIEIMEQTLTQVIEGGVDAIMASYGTARRFAKKMARVGLVLRIDGAGTVLGPMDGPGAQFYTVEDALRLGADALCVTAFPGSPVEEPTLEVLARVIRQAHAWGLPVMAEMVPGGFDSGPEFRTHFQRGIVRDEPFPRCPTIERSNVAPGASTDDLGPAGIRDEFHDRRRCGFPVAHERDQFV